jgi:hypothetical protein
MHMPVDSPAQMWHCLAVSQLLRQRATSSGSAGHKPQLQIRLCRAATADCSACEPALGAGTRHCSRAGLMFADPINLKEGGPVGCLGLEQHTRRRNRVNGHVRAWDAADGELLLTVDQSFGGAAQNS